MARAPLAGLVLLTFPTAATGAQPSPIDQAFNRFYNYDPPGACAILDEYISRQYQDPRAMSRGAPRISSQS